jgi:hypothetical protein
MSFAFDQITGQVFRGSELFIRAKHRIVKSADSHALIFLDKSPRHAAEDLSKIYSALEGDNEVIVGTDSSPHLPIEGYAVVRVVGGVIDELPAKAEEPLRAAILNAALDALPASKPGSVHQTVNERAPTAVTPRESVEAVFDHNDHVLGGSDHETTFLEAFGRARENVVVHSTFISGKGQG